MKIDGRGADLRTCSERHDEELAELRAMVNTLRARMSTLEKEVTKLLPVVRNEPAKKEEDL